MWLRRGFTVRLSVKDASNNEVSGSIKELIGCILYGTVISSLVPECFSEYSLEKFI